MVLDYDLPGRPVQCHAEGDAPKNSASKRSKPTQRDPCALQSRVFDRCDCSVLVSWTETESPVATIASACCLLLTSVSSHHASEAFPVVLAKVVSV